jgi:predicted oxidoreductase
MDRGPDFVVAGDLRELVAGMNRLTSEPLVGYQQIPAQIRQRDAETTNPFSKDTQVMASATAAATSATGWCG